MAYNAPNYGFQAHFPLHLNIDDFGVFIKLVIATWSQILFAFPKRANYKLIVYLWFVPVQLSQYLGRLVKWKRGISKIKSTLICM